MYCESYLLYRIWIPPHTQLIIFEEFLNYPSLHMDLIPGFAKSFHASLVSKLEIRILVAWASIVLRVEKY